MSDESASSLQDANEQVVHDMIKDAERNKKAREVSGEAISWIMKILKESRATNDFYIYVVGSSNQVVEVENIFEGQTGDGTSWQMRFVINADFPNKTREQAAHFGCQVFWNGDRSLNTHKWLSDELLKVGRPTSPGVKLEEFETGSDRKNFDNKRYVTWKSISKKYS